MDTNIRDLLVAALLAGILTACNAGGVGGGGPTLEPSLTPTLWYTEDSTKVASQTPSVSATAAATPTATSMAQHTPTPLGTSSPPPSIIEVTPLGGYGDVAGVVRFTVATVIRDCSEAGMWVGVGAGGVDEHALIGTDRWQPSPTTVCPKMSIPGVSNIVDVGTAGQFAYFYYASDGEVWAVTSSKTYHAIAICYAGRSRADLWYGIDMYEWSTGGIDETPISPCSLARPYG